ncbi:CHRNA7-FAM7A fusion protein-like, partial [Patella vulgata]|uniref:CHRNA7-FAM7A fusion protein-like n=1 Tax=Patella vulgata TaxID=6465 RepID=UPI0024A8115F
CEIDTSKYPFDTQTCRLDFSHRGSVNGGGLPVLLLSFTKICAFIIPASSGEKLSFSITILLSMAIYMSSINSVMPETT